MNWPFWKMHGAGNDFVLFDDQHATFPAADRAWLAGIARRRTGIGCEGIILLQPAAEADFQMRFLNPDGGEAELCGNGLRCAARLAHELGYAPAHMRIATAAGCMTAEIMGDAVRVALPAPTAWACDRELALPDGPVHYDFVQVGVPHAVVEVADLASAPVATGGAAIRRHPDFAPAGTNVDFVTRTGPSTICVRTYERGVEGETGACGTGVAAAALVLARRDRVAPPVHAATTSGATLTIDFTPGPDGPADLTLRGPAEHVFQGTLPGPAGKAATP